MSGVGLLRVVLGGFKDLLGHPMIPCSWMPPQHAKKTYEPNIREMSSTGECQYRDRRMIGRVSNKTTRTELFEDGYTQSWGLYQHRKQNCLGHRH